jgi:hypothetical protein
MRKGDPLLFIRRFGFVLVLTSSLSALGQEAGGSHGAEVSVFTNDERTELSGTLKKDIEQAQRDAYRNYLADTAFKWAAAGIACLVTILAGLSKMHDFKDYSRAFGTLLIIFGAIGTVLAGAVPQFGFADREAMYDTKAHVLQGLSLELEYTDPKKADFLNRLNTARAWNVFTKIQELRLPEVLPQPTLPASTPG